MKNYLNKLFVSIIVILIFLGTLYVLSQEVIIHGRIYLKKTTDTTKHKLSW